MNGIDKELLKLVVCPLTHDPVELAEDKLVNVKWGVKYPIRDGVPVMLLDEAELPEDISSIRELKARINATAP